LSFYFFESFFFGEASERDGRGEFAEKDGAIPENFARRFAPPRPNLKIRNIIRGRRASARFAGLRLADAVNFDASTAFVGEK
jgi:hypothetical protein